MVNSKQKGKRCEREAAAKLVELGFLNARRGWADGYDLMPDSVPGIWFEVKGVEALNLRVAMRQARETAALRKPPGLVPVVMHKVKRSPWRFTLDADDLPAFVEAVGKAWIAAEEELGRPA